MKNIAPPKTKKKLRSFISLINHYQDMWIRRSDMLTPLTALTSKESKCDWTPTHQSASDKMKQIISSKVILTYPEFSKTFEIYTNASHSKLGAFITQDNKPIAFHSRKLNPAQPPYTATEQELLAIVETLKELQNILLG